jgi:hypothetical protein
VGHGDVLILRLFCHRVEIADAEDQDASGLAATVYSISSVSLPGDGRQPRSETVKLPETPERRSREFRSFSGFGFPADAANAEVFADLAGAFHRAETGSTHSRSSS